MKIYLATGAEIMKNLMLIVNPKAGKGQAKGSVGTIVSVFRDHGYFSHVFMTRKPGEAQEFAQTYGKNYELLVCVGGDGTLSDVIAGVSSLKDGEKPVIGYIPMGTANDVASSLSLSKTPMQAAEVIMTGKTIYLDVGRMNGNSFSYIAAFGAFADVSYTTPQNTKNVLGHLAYLIEGAARLPEIKPHHAVVEHDGGTIEGDFLFGCVMNTLSVGGIIKFDPSTVELSDGYFEIILIRQPANFFEYGDIISAVTTKKFNNKNVTMLHTKTAKFTFNEPVSWTRDGENGGAHTVLDVSNLQCAVQIVVPKDGD